MFRESRFVQLGGPHPGAAGGPCPRRVTGTERSPQQTRDQIRMLVTGATEPVGVEGYPPPPDCMPTPSAPTSTCWWPQVRSNADAGLPAGVAARRGSTAPPTRPTNWWRTCARCCRISSAWARPARTTRPSSATPPSAGPTSWHPPAIRLRPRPGCRSGIGRGSTHRSRLRRRAVAAGRHRGAAGVPLRAADQRPPDHLRHPHRTAAGIARPHRSGGPGARDGGVADAHRLSGAPRSARPRAPARHHTTGTASAPKPMSRPRTRRPPGRQPGGRHSEPSERQRRRSHRRRRPRQGWSLLHPRRHLAGPAHRDPPRRP